MVLSNPNRQYGYPHQPAEFPIDTKPSEYYAADDAAEDLSSPLFAADMMSSPDAQIRRASLANSAGILSPADSHGWEQQFGSEIDPASTASSRGYRPQQAIRPNVPRVQTFPGQSQPPWPYESHSGHVTPSTATGYGPQPVFAGTQAVPYTFPPMDGPQPIFHPAPHSQMQPQPQPQPPRYRQPPSEPFFVPMVQSHPKSPHSHEDYMALAQSEIESSKASKRMRSQSPPRTSVDAQRQDGIRKKNGRIDIPHERSIHHIDQLLAKEENENMIKELKQQKRLLRNREAALASRQRKKKHTEDLESAQKNSNGTIAHLNQETIMLRERCQELECQRYAVEQDLRRQLDMAEENARRQTLAHQEETSKLRKQIQIYRDNPDPAPAMSTIPSSTGYTECNAGLEALTMEQNPPWEDFLNDISDAPDEFSFDIKPESVLHRPTLQRKSFSTNDAASHPVPEQDSSIGSGLLFFLLLCGALVASKPASSRPSDMPAVPDNVHAAAPAVLDNLLADSNTPGQPPLSHTRRDSTLEPRAPLTSARPRGSRLDRMHQKLTAPTKQQEIEQAWSLTPAQYASISDPDFHSHDDHNIPRTRARPSLAEALAQSQRDYVRNSNADVYTRSLLMEQIPADVVAQFKEWAQNRNEMDAQQQQQQQNDDEFGYKLET